MPCHSAIEKKSVTAKPDDSVEKTLKAMRKAKATAVAVVDDENVLLGVFSMKILLRNLIPVSVAMADGVQIDVTVQAAPGVAKRLNNVMPLDVAEVMERKPCTVSPDSAIWEGVGFLIKNGTPLCVVDEASKFHGFITYDSLVIDLENMQTTDS
ncbi:MAG: CBS domain-containing protein [Alphaproteobacteria bacterium]